jgi:ubiquinone/menaquinone biosynthesis C-methylase UbiE
MDPTQKLPPGFSTPIELPSDEIQALWQDQNRSWWQKNPMRYDWGGCLSAGEFSKEFYQEIDERFFSDSWRYMPWKTRPFEAILPFEELATKDVLEIGVGNGSHAQLISPHCKSYVGIDLTDYAVNSTSKRFEVFGLKGTIRLMDAEKLDFPDGSFDFIWTWGVIHHSANTGRILEQMKRVLKPGGKATIMVYHRSFLYFQIFTGLFRGIVCGGFLRANSLHELVQIHTDGAIARFYRPSEWRDLIESNGFTLEMETIKGQKSEIFPLPASKFKDAIMKLMPNAISRFVTNNLRQGSFLITTIRKV